MVRIALVEDDANYRQELTEYLNRFSQECGEHFAISTFSDGAEVAEGYTADFDIILMDIAMAYMDGMSAAEAIRRVDDEVVIIFLTSMPQYAMKGYSVGALDYVLKPVSYFAFAKTMDRAMNRLRRRKRRYVLISSKNGTQRIDCARVYYIEVDGHNLTYHTADGALLSTGTMREVEDSLAGGSFFRCGKGVLVNLEHVEGLVEGDALVHGATVQVSRSKRKSFLDALNRYINEVNL